jgi:hypothetical protein
MVTDEQERRPETLDLQRPRQLDLDAVPDTPGRKHQEGHEEQRDDRNSDPEAAHRLPPATPLPGVCKPEREEHGGVELRCNAEPEQRMTQLEPPHDERRERAD